MNNFWKKINGNAVNNCDEGVAKRSVFRKTVSFIARFLISAALIVWIFKFIDFGIFKESVLSPKLVPLASLVLYGILFVFLGGFKLWILFRNYAVISCGQFLKYFFFSSSIGSIAPAILGDVTLIALAKRIEVSAYQSVSAILLDRFITLFIAVFVFTPFTIIYVTSISPVHVLYLTIACFVFSVFIVWFIVKYSPRILNKYAVTKELWEAFAHLYRNRRTDLYNNLFITLVRAIVSGFTLVAAFQAAGLHPPVIPTVSAANSLSILTHIPISISGLGVFEGSGLLFFEAIGLNKEKVLAGFFFHRLYVIVWALLTAIIIASLSAYRKYIVHSSSGI